MTYDLSHLPVSVRPQAFGAAEDRIRQVHTAHWVGYPRADLFLEHFERLFRHPACTRMPCALLYGDSGIGKTMILEKFSRAHRPVRRDRCTVPYGGADCHARDSDTRFVATPACALSCHR
jgi:predicted ATPase